MRHPYFVQTELGGRCIRYKTNVLHQNQQNYDRNKLKVNFKLNSRIMTDRNKISQLN